MDLLPKIHRGFKKKKEVDPSDGANTFADEATEVRNDNFEAAYVSPSSDILLKKVTKMPKSKKSRRAPNAFLLFASEMRKNVSSDNKSPGYVSRILGGMWKDMALEEKEKYLLEARRLGAQLKIDSLGYLESPSETVKIKKCKSELKCKPIKKLRKKNRGPTTKKVLRSSFSSTTESSKNNMIPEKKEEQTVCVAKQSAVEAADPVGVPKGESKPTIDYSFRAYNLGNSSIPAASSSNALEPPCRCHHSQYHHLVDRWADVSAQPPMFGAGMHMPYFGAGLSPSLFPQNPLADASFWMYRQSFQNPYNFPPPAFANSYSSFSYPPYTPYSSLYSNSYIADRCCGHFNTLKPSFSAAANATSATTTSMTNATASSMTNATATNMTYATATSITHGDKEEQDDKMDFDSTLLVVDVDEPEVPEGR